MTAVGVNGTGPRPIRQAPPPPADVPEIIITADVEGMAQAAVAAIARDGSIYQRAGSLVHVVKSVEPPKGVAPGRVERPGGVPVIRLLSPAVLFGRLSKCARWLKPQAKGTYKHALPSDRAARMVHDLGEWGGVRRLAAATTAPTFRPDGSVLQAPGYDEATGLLFWPNAKFPTVPDRPTKEDAARAYAMLTETVRHFPFASGAQKAGWATSVLSLLARPAIDGPVPLFILDANTQGSGKSKLADATFLIALGTDAARTALPEDDENEFRKRITALALEGDPAVLIDNVKGQLASPALEAAITSTRWKDRVLGASGMVSAPMRIVWFASGNNLGTSSDVARRSMHIRLESPLENPEDREGLPDLEQWILKRRPALVVAALTILRAWHVAGRPSPCRPWGSFEAWSGVVPNAIAWASDIDPLLARMSTEVQASTEKMSIAAVLECIESIQPAPGRGVTARTLIATLYGESSGRRGGDEGAAVPDAHPSYAGAREALESECATRGSQRPDAKRVGYFLRRCLGRVVAGRRLSQGAPEHNVVTWLVVRPEMA